MASRGDKLLCSQADAWRKKLEAEA